MIVGETGNLTRQEISKVVRAHCKLHHDEADKLVSLVFECMTAALVADRRVEIRGFGSLRCNLMPAREVFLNGKALHVLPKFRIVFKQAKELGDLVNDGRAELSEPGSPPPDPEGD